MHAASITNAIDRLEHRVSCSAGPHPSDGRAVLARITPAGRRLGDKATEAINREVFATLELPARASTTTSTGCSARSGAGGSG